MVTSWRARNGSPGGHQWRSATPPHDRVRVVLGDTEVCPYSCYGTADSRGSVVGGAAVLEASRLLRTRVTRLI